MADDNEGFQSILENPSAAAQIEALLKDDPEDTPSPTITYPVDGFVRLPGGIVVGGKQVEEVEVLELTGEAEEKVAKARTSNDPTRFITTLLEEGLPEEINGVPTSQVLDEMLVGDREAILLGIRKATFGAEIELGRARCQECREEFDAVLDANDIPVKELTEDSTFHVNLRKGGRAKVRLPRGKDWKVFMKDPDLTPAERNSVVLCQCIVTLPSGGEEMPVAAFPSLVFALGIADRRKILEEIDKRTPGPQYTGLEIEHECGTKIPVPPLGMVPLFPGL